jgi:hypothetical protein
MSAVDMSAIAFLDGDCAETGWREVAWHVPECMSNAVHQFIASELSSQRGQ